MVPAAGSLSDLEEKAASGAPFTRADAERVLASADLIGIGMVGQAARQRHSGAEVTFLRVASVSGGVVPDELGDPGEVRIVGVPRVLDDATSTVEKTAAAIGAVPLTGYSARDLLDLAGHNRRALVDTARALAGAGLHALAEFPVDAFDTTEEAIEVAREIEMGGLGIWRLTIDVAPLAGRLALIERAGHLSSALATVRAFAPLPRLDPADAPSTGYDDVRTVAVTGMLCPRIRYVQVDWPFYGPKLAQVAIAYGANDIDGVSAVDSMDLGPRRSPREDIKRQIQAAGAVAIERDGRGERRS